MISKNNSRMMNTTFQLEGNNNDIYGCSRNYSNSNIKPFTNKHLPKYPNMNLNQTYYRNSSFRSFIKKGKPIRQFHPSRGHVESNMLITKVDSYIQKAVQFE